MSILPFDIATATREGLCDEIDRLRAALAESERLKEKAALSYVGAIAERDRARADALEEAACHAQIWVVGRLEPDQGEALAAAIRALA